MLVATRAGEAGAYLGLVPAHLAETGETLALRTQVREFVRSQIVSGAIEPSIDAWLMGWDRDFTLRVAERGWIGMTVPTEYGGQGRTFQERFVVTEELLAAGAPTAAHWIADRQMAPALLRFGTEEQKHSYLPGICAGRLSFAIGMSEPDSGSDLASIRTRAHRVVGGWRLTGTKVWSSGAHLAQTMVVLARTEAPDPKARHAGLSQFLLDLDAASVEIRPVRSMTGGAHFNEVVLGDVFVPDKRVLGQVGAGWEQVTAELSHERSGPERFLSTFPLVEALAGLAQERDVDAAALGRQVARIAGLHHMSMAVSGALQAREQVDAAAAMVKVIGTSAEGDVVELAEAHGVRPRAAGDQAERLLAEAALRRPGFTIRGGTNEILRGTLARSLGMR